MLKFEIKVKGHHSICKRGHPKSSIFYIKISTLDGFCVILNRNSLMYLSNNFNYAYTVLKN